MFLVKSRGQEAFLLSGYILLLFVSAVMRDFVINPYIAHHMSGIGATILIEPVWKLLTWITPTFLYIYSIEGKNPLVYLKLKRPWQGLAWGIFGCLFVAALELGNILRSHTFQPQSVDTWVNVILLVGVMEEVPFRGFLFQKLQDFFGMIGAVIVSSLLFAAIHVPLWASTGQSISWPFFLGLITVFGVGVLACIVLKLSDSLWSSIVVHTFYNLLTSFL